ncbi:hypothetical protein BDF20DRAFT_811752 [Mycotypha africana]|uniref:uncharacterized protein n=1 Tax=Mycotypha africana TaxID=64632 RepID=UPI002300ACFD|nr:uncharacterized protein BDF20DRAFT_811752 [Mycotypha africana]KAI8991351.1 hypothetical protein BDF20DRAFT_811752 [Mycotypha africana]
MNHHLYEESLSQESFLSSSSSTCSSSPSLENLLAAANSTKTTTTTTTQPQFTLSQVLSNPKLLCAFECFLRQSWAHENLLFIEAITQLKHETDPQVVESILHRIYKTFLAQGSPLELNVTTQEKVEKDLNTLQWAIVDKIDAVTILEETEAQVLDMLEIKLSEFMQTMDFSLGTINPAKIKSEQVRVCIIGGGFTGFTVASILDQMPRFYVTLIDTKDSFEYTPGIVRKIIHPEQSSSLRVRHDAYVQNGRVIIGYAENLANKGKSVTVNGEVIKFDYLVIATGSSYSSQLKSMDTSSLYRTTGLEQSYLELLKARKVLIIGGGLVGCELASEISQHTFPGAYPKKEVTLVDSHSNVVSRSDVRQQAVALKYLEDLGVNVICNERIIDFDSSNANIYLGSSGRLYSGYDKVFIATGTRPNTSLFTAMPSDSSLETCIDVSGRIKVKSTLQIDHYRYKHIFAGGDVTNVVEEKTGYAATISGVCIARNICRLVKGKAPLKQGTKGTLPAPHKPLHGMLEHGGIGKQNLNSIKKRFSFLNPSWAALKYFDEQQFLKIVQGQGTINSSQVLGRLPRKLNLPPSSNPSSLAYQLLNHPHDRNQHLNSKSTPTPKAVAANMARQRSCRHENAQNLHWTSRNKLPTENDSFNGSFVTSTDSNRKVEEDYTKPLEGFLFEHFTFGGEDLHLFTNSHPVASVSPRENKIYNHHLSPQHHQPTTGAKTVANTTTRKRSNTTRAESHHSTNGTTTNTASTTTAEYIMPTVYIPHQLSPPPPPRNSSRRRRRASLSSSFNALSLTSTKSSSANSKCMTAVPLTRSPSFSSITSRF